MFAWKRIRWFVLGFAVVFVGIAVFRKVGFFTGQAVYIVPLWQYYWLEIQRAAMSTGNVGATSGAGGAALSMFFQHLFVSLAGGAAIHFLAARRKSTDPPAK